VTNAKKRVWGTLFFAFGLELDMREQRGGKFLRVMDEARVLL
jgi:hypothetical protein